MTTFPVSCAFRGTAAALILAITAIAPHPARAQGECYWFSVDDIVGKCSDASAGGVIEPAPGAEAISCGDPGCQSGRAEGCIEFGIGPQSAQPPRWDVEYADMLVAWVSNSPTPGWGSTATTGSPGAGTPYDACKAVLSDAAQQLGY